jgi:hypothetical protein
VAAVGDFSHRASLPAASLPSYPVILTKPRGTIAGNISPIEETLSTLSTELSTIAHGYYINFRFLVELES